MISFPSLEWGKTLQSSFTSKAFYLIKLPSLSLYRLDNNLTKQNMCPKLESSLLFVCLFSFPFFKFGTKTFLKTELTAVTLPLQWVLYHRTIELFELEGHLAHPSPQWAGTSLTTPGSSETRPAWPWMLPGMGHLPPLWAACSSISPPSL